MGTGCSASGGELAFGSRHRNNASNTNNNNNNNNTTNSNTNNNNNNTNSNTNNTYLVQLKGGGGGGGGGGGNGSEASPLNTSRRGEDYDVIAATAANPNATTHVDYRGLPVVMVNATASKVNAVCRWADAVLAVRERNGGCFADPQRDGAPGVRWENNFGASIGDGASSTAPPESSCSGPYRLNVSLYQTVGGGPSSSRQYEKSQSSRYFEKSHSSIKPTEKSIMSTRVTEKSHSEEKEKIGEEGQDEEKDQIEEYKESKQTQEMKVRLETEPIGASDKKQESDEESQDKENEESQVTIRTWNKSCTPMKHYVE